MWFSTDWSPFAVPSLLWQEKLVTQQVPVHYSWYHSGEVTDHLTAPQLGLNAIVNICHAMWCTVPKIPDCFLFFPLFCSRLTFLLPVLPGWNTAPAWSGPLVWGEGEVHPSHSATTSTSLDSLQLVTPPWPARGVGGITLGSCFLFPEWRNSNKSMGICLVLPTSFTQRNHKGPN